MVPVCNHYFCSFSSTCLFIPNFQNISYQPLLGYAGFLGIMSLIISFLIWYFLETEKNRRKIKLEKRFANMMMKSHFVVIINNNFSTLLPSYLKQSCFYFFLSLFLLILKSHTIIDFDENNLIKFII